MLSVLSPATSGAGVAFDSDDFSVVTCGGTEGDGWTMGGVSDGFGVESDGKRESRLGDRRSFITRLFLAVFGVDLVVAVAVDMVDVADMAVWWLMMGTRRCWYCARCEAQIATRRACPRPS